MKSPQNASKYTYVVAWSADDEAYVARVAEFKSLAAHGDTAADALTEIQDVVKNVLVDLEENGERIPKPLSETKYSGKFVLRMTPSMHRRFLIGILATVALAVVWVYFLLNPIF